MNKFVLNSILVLVGFITLYILGMRLIQEKKVQSFGSYMASSSEMTASSTSNTSNVNASTTILTSIQDPLSSVSAFLNFIYSLASTTSQVSDINSDHSTTSSYNSLINLPTTSVYTPKGSLKVFIAQTSATQEQGLSDIPSLPNGVGMLFVFDSPGQYSFWMKDMHFPLDMVWIDSNKIVSDISKDALPSSYPATFTPSRPILYVIEINANTAKNFGII